MSIYGGYGLLSEKFFPPPALAGNDWVETFLIPKYIGNWKQLAGKYIFSSQIILEIYFLTPNYIGNIFSHPKFILEITFLIQKYIGNWKQPAGKYVGIYIEHILRYIETFLIPKYKYIGNWKLTDWEIYCLRTTSLYFGWQQSIQHSLATLTRAVFVYLYLWICK